MSGEAPSSDHLPINLAQEYRVKLGKSFTFPEQNAFHTLKYDFKPQSVDPTRPGHLIITDEGAVNVSLPVGQGEAGGDFAQFRGPKKSCVKECILIIDTTTEEAILERISDTVQLKATRDNRKHVLPRDRSVSPSPLLTQSKPPPLKQPAFKSSTHLTPPLKQHASSSLASSKKTKSSTKPSKSDPLGRGGGAGSKVGSKGADKGKRGKLVKSASQPTKAPLPFQVASLASGGTTAATSGSSLTVSGMDFSTPDISPLRSSTNPTPEPGAKRPKLSSSSSSSTGSSSSDSEGMMEEVRSHARHVTQQRGIPPVRPIPGSQAERAFGGGGGGSQPSASMQKFSASHQPMPKGFGRTSSAGRPSTVGQGMAGGRPPGGVATSSDSLPPQMQHHFVRSSSAHDMTEPSLSQPATATPSVVPRLTSKPGGGAVGGSQPVPGSRSGAPSTLRAVGSSSGSSSMSDSSSDSSSSDSSSGDSEGENDREVAHAFSRPPQPPPARQMSMSVLRHDLDLSESGSDSD